MESIVKCQLVLFREHFDNKYEIDIRKDDNNALNLIIRNMIINKNSCIKTAERITYSQPYHSFTFAYDYELRVLKEPSELCSYLQTMTIWSAIKVKYQ